MIGHPILPSFSYSIVFKLKRLPFLRTAFFGYWVFFLPIRFLLLQRRRFYRVLLCFFFHQSEAVPFPSGSDWERWLVSQFYRVLPSFSYLVERRTPFWFHRHALFTEFYWVFFVKWKMAPWLKMFHCYRVLPSFSISLISLLIFSDFDWDRWFWTWFYRVLPSFSYFSNNSQLDYFNVW